MKHLFSSEPYVSYYCASSISVILLQGINVSGWLLFSGWDQACWYLLASWNYQLALGKQVLARLSVSQRGVYVIEGKEGERTVVTFLLQGEGDPPSECRWGLTTLVMLEGWRLGIKTHWRRCTRGCWNCAPLAPQRDKCAVFWTKVIFWAPI